MSQKLILNGKYQSRCHQAPTILVKSRDGGFVTQDCSVCGRPESIGLNELPPLVCGQCKRELRPLLRGKYYYSCDDCGIEWELPSLIPNWNELFPHYGYGLPSDIEV